jgi:hypothetical protein
MIYEDRTLRRALAELCSKNHHVPSAAPGPSRLEPLTKLLVTLVDFGAGAILGPFVSSLVGDALGTWRYFAGLGLFVAAAVVPVVLRRLRR